MDGGKQMSVPHSEQTQGLNPAQNWDPGVTLNNLLFLEKKVHQLRDSVHMMIGCRCQAPGQFDELLVQQQQLINAELTSIIVQLISTAGNLLPPVRHAVSSKSSVNQTGQFGGVMNQSVGVPDNIVIEHRNDPNKVEDHEMKSDDDADGENLAPGSYEILQLEKEEILAAHTHFCPICTKGFKRDANLRMHMRGHGDEYKTPAALSKPTKESCSKPLIKRYSCPYIGCKRNKEHKKFQPLKTILCVKNHYKRTHCDKTFTCSRCHKKKFSVIADLKTHEKHCGRDKWLCSCGTTFSRKDKLFGHISLFQGHTPAVPVEESRGHTGPSDQQECREAVNKAKQPELPCKADFPSGCSAENGVNVPGSVEDPLSYFPPMNFEATCGSLPFDFGTRCTSVGFLEFPQSPFEDSENNLSFILCSGYPPDTPIGVSRMG